ncbi:exodeoxyribonuclease VII small subunit, partial [Candidatus Sumerlaeota bacterium]|nr:exodeoxyribonuclease VII small subunit [Candidatus Sumerlaeota bacterium]
MQAQNQQQSDEKFNYEKAFKQLEEIVEQLEDENTPLEKAIELFTEGKRLADLCLKKLTELEQRVQLLLEDKEGKIKVEEFSPEKEDNSD